MPNIIICKEIYIYRYMKIYNIHITDASFISAPAPIFDIFYFIS